MNIKFHQNRLVLKTKFTISHGAYNHRDQLLVELSEQNNTGLGETVAIDYYGQNIEKMLELARKAAPELHTLSSQIAPKTFYKHLLRAFPTNPFLRCAFDTAYSELYQKLNGIILEAPVHSELPSSITIGLSDTLESIEEKLGQSWPFYKVKINEKDFRQEVIEKISLTGKAFGIDANGAFEDLGRAQKAIDFLHNFGCVYIEQLLSKNKSEEIQKLDRPKGSQFFLDESITTKSEAAKYLNIYDGFVLKLTKCGGITPILDIIHFAKENGKKLLAGCMTESSIGINHMLKLLPFFDYADLDGAYLISNDKDIIGKDNKNLRFLKDDGFFYP